MSWGKVDDQLHAHPKAYEAGLEAMGLWTLCLSHCSAFLTDGFVSAVTVARIGSPHGLELAERLVDSGLWEKVKGGFCFHDYLEHNPSAVEVKEARRLAKERQARRRKVGGETPPPSTRDRRSDRGIVDSVTRDNQRDSRVTHSEVTSHVTRDSHTASRVSHTTPTRPDPIEEITHSSRACEVATDQAVEPDPSPPSQARPVAPPVVPRREHGPPIAREGLQILKRIESHPSLKLLAHEKYAEMALDWVIAGRKLEWIFAAIDDLGHKAKVREINGTPWNLDTLSERLMTFCKNAKAPRDSQVSSGGNGVVGSAGQSYRPHDAPPAYEYAEGVTLPPSAARKKREQEEARAAGNGR